MIRIVVVLINKWDPRNAAAIMDYVTGMITGYLIEFLSCSV